jgi:hypothetical protein
VSINQANAIRRLRRLDEWTFVFGLPTTESEFTHAKAYGEFCLLPPPLLGFRDYRVAMLDSFEHHIAPLAQLGLRIVRYATARQYGRLLRATNATVLFTHSDGSRLEFRDGMVSFPQLAETIDPQFAGIAEICACAPDQLQDIIKARAPGAAVKVSGERLSSSFWMAYYGYFLAGFAAEPASYADACLRAGLLLDQLRRPAVDPA